MRLYNEKSYILRSRIYIYFNSICNSNNDDAPPMGNTRGDIMKTFKIIRTERVKEIKTIKATNEEEALKKMTYDNWDNCEILSSETEIEEIINEA
jgi:hypothetical protein